METAVRPTIRFLLNDRPIEIDDVAPDAMLLDWLRLDRRLTGTKEGCGEGDCGACTVLAGRLVDGEPVYEAVNACIRFLASCDGCHIVTVEHLAGHDGALHPVQQAMVDLHGSQCGFCTPGFVMSLYALWMRNQSPSDIEIETALQGNLCRCTGYEAIMRAGRAMGGYGRPGGDRLAGERAAVISVLEAYVADKRRVEIECADGKLFMPTSLDDFAFLYDAHPKATVVAGATDVGLWVTKQFRSISPVIFIGQMAELKAISIAGNSITIGAGVSYAQARSVLGEVIPALGALIDRIGGGQVRNMGTIGGNIANGSPIGDTPPPLIALGATLTLRKGATRRTVALEDFFINYGKQDRAPGEFVESVQVPLPAEGAHFAAYKISKRRDEDITSTLGAFHLALDANNRVTSVRIAFGGMAATPKRAKAVEAALLGKAWTLATVEAALPEFETDFKPLTDMRASADYRMLASKNLLKRFFLETTSAASPLARQAAE